MAMPIDMSTSGPKGRYDPSPIEVVRGESLWSPSSAHRITSASEPIDPVYRPITTPPRTIAERFEDFQDRIKKTCGWCRDVPGPLLLLFFLVFLGIIITAAILILIFALPGTQTLPLILGGSEAEMVIADVTWPLFAEKDDDTLVEFSSTNVDKCTGFGFSCMSRPDEFVAKSQRCDGVPDCGDSSDEKFCASCTTGYACPPRPDQQRSKASALQRICLTPESICDGVNHCPDGWDESNFCKKTCMETEFVCPGSNNKGLQKCLPMNVRCNGVKDCSNGHDEEGCTECVKGAMFCEADGKCIASAQRCDGKKDCSDGSDEKGCDCVTCSGGGRVLCQDKERTCIMASQICDDVADCADGIDELRCINGKSNFTIEP